MGYTANDNDDGDNVDDDDIYIYTVWLEYTGVHSGCDSSKVSSYKIHHNRMSNHEQQIKIVIQFCRLIQTRVVIGYTRRTAEFD